MLHIFKAILAQLLYALVVAWKSMGGSVAFVCIRVLHAYESH
jgi:hypothetical protein